MRIGEIVKKKYGLKVLKFKNAKEIMPYARPVFHTLNAAFAPLYGFAQLTEKQIDYYINMYIPMLRYDLVTLIVRKRINAVVGFGILPAQPFESLAKGSWAYVTLRLDSFAESVEEQTESNRPVFDRSLAGISK